MAPGIEFGLLGPITVRSEGVALPVLPGKQRAVLAALLLKAGQVVGLDDLVEALWGSVPPLSARVTLQNYVMRLRKALPDTSRPLISTEPGGYLIRVDAGELDVSRFEAMLGAARAAVRDGSWETAAGQARAALSLWRGEPLADVESELLSEREAPRLLELRLQALEVRVDVDLHLGRHAEVIGELHRLAAAHPQRERLHALLMLALYRDSRQGEALAAYQRARRVLVAELGVEPGAQLRGLHQQILASEPHLMAKAARAGLASAGESIPDSASSELVDRHAERVSVLVPRQLPTGLPHFAGRAAQLAMLSRLVEERVPGTRTVVISAIGGMAGVGKTALAVHWAHLVAGRFPDGQLYVNLRGFGPSGGPAEPAVAIRGFLEGLGVAADRIPATPDAQAGLFRSLLAGRRMLLVLDNARDEDQVRSLLPGSPTCVVVVTSRTRLAGLAVGEGAQLVNVDPLTDADAREVLTRRLGPGRIAAEPDAVSALIGLCGGLPLALAITAARAADHPGFTLAALAAELRDGQQLGALGTGEAATSVRAVFSWSYQHLAEPAARMFRLLGLHPGHDFTGPAAARLAGLPDDGARDLLRGLARAHLLTEPAPGRYAFHDLLQAYAAWQAAATDGEDERGAALTRLFDYYLAVTGASMDILFPAERDHRPKVGLPATVMPPVETPAAARGWLDAERANLVAIAGHAARDGWPGHTTRLAGIMFRYLDYGGYYPDALTIQTHALDAARQAGDRAARADALRSGSIIDYRQGRYERTGDQLRQALAIYRNLGDRYGQGRTLSNLGLVLRRQGSYLDAIGHYRQALELLHDIGDEWGQALALDNLGLVFCQQGRYQEAAGHHRQAMALWRELGDRCSAAASLDNLGVALRRQGLMRQAADCHEVAIALFRGLGYRDDEASALNRLGAAVCGQGRYQLAADYHRRAHALFRNLGNRPGESEALNGLGEALTALGAPAEARACHHDALTLASEIKDRYQQARAHDGLAHAYSAVSDTARARHHWHNALTRYRDMKVPEAAQIQAKLDNLTDAAP
jgi:DNA-binding SARP family transcriptional activator/tetratricopeptide (TPR) repeat protein